MFVYQRVSIEISTINRRLHQGLTEGNAPRPSSEHLLGIESNRGVQLFFFPFKRQTTFKIDKYIYILYIYIHIIRHYHCFQKIRPLVIIIKVPAFINPVEQSMCVNVLMLELSACIIRFELKLRRTSGDHIHSLRRR